MNISHLELDIFYIVLPRIKFYVSLHDEYEYQYNFVETPSKFMVALVSLMSHIISTDEDPSLQIEIFAMINLRGVSTKLY